MQDRVERAASDLPRVEAVLAEAVREQLDEQRALTRLVGRVEAALARFQEGFGEVGERVEGAAQPLAEALSRTRGELTEAVRRLERRAEQAEARNVEQLTGLAGRLHDIEEALVGAAEGAGQERLDALREELATRLAAREAQGAQALTEARRALRDQGLHLEALRGALATEADGAAARMSHLLETMARDQRSATRAVAEAGATFERSAAQARSSIAQAVEDAAASMREAAEAQVARLGDTLSEIRPAVEELGLRLAGDLDRAVRAAAAPVSSAAADLRSTGEAVRTATQAQLSGLRRDVEDGAAALDRAAAALPGLGEQVAASAQGDLQTALDQVRADLDGLAESLRAAVFEQLADGRRATDAAVERLESIGGEASQGLRSELAALREEVGAARSGLAEAVDSTRTALHDRLAVVESSLVQQAGTVRAAAEGAGPTLEAAVDGIRARLLADLSEVLDTSVGAALRRLSTQADGVVAQGAQAAEEVAARVVEAGERLDGLTERIETAARRLDQAGLRDADHAVAALADLQVQAEAVLEGMRQESTEHLAIAGEALDRRFDALAERLAELLVELHGEPPAQHLAAEVSAGLDDPGEHVLARRCAECGFVAKTPAGLSAHRRVHR